MGLVKFSVSDLFNVYETLLRIPHDSALRHRPETQQALIWCRDSIADALKWDAEKVQNYGELSATFKAAPQPSPATPPQDRQP